MKLLNCKRVGRERLKVVAEGNGCDKCLALKNIPVSRVKGIKYSTRSKFWVRVIAFTHEPIPKKIYVASKGNRRMKCVFCAMLRHIG